MQGNIEVRNDRREFGHSSSTGVWRAVPALPSLGAIGAGPFPLRLPPGRGCCALAGADAVQASSSSSPACPQGWAAGWGARPVPGCLRYAVARAGGTASRWKWRRGGACRAGAERGGRCGVLPARVTVRVPGKGCTSGCSAGSELAKAGLRGRGEGAALRNPSLNPDGTERMAEHHSHFLPSHLLPRPKAAGSSDSLCRRSFDAFRGEQDLPDKPHPVVALGTGSWCARLFLHPTCAQTARVSLRAHGHTCVRTSTALCVGECASTRVYAWRGEEGLASLGPVLALGRVTGSSALAGHASFLCLPC